MLSKADVSFFGSFSCCFFQGRFGHEWLEFELHPDGTLLYSNETKYRGEKRIRKELKVSSTVQEEFCRIIRESKVRTNVRFVFVKRAIRVWFGFFFFSSGRTHIHRDTNENESQKKQVISRGREGSLSFDFFD